MSIKNYNLEKLNILIVDDDLHMRQIVRCILYSLGVRNICEAANGADALADMGYFHPDIVISDWNMEPLNGVEFIKLVRSASDSPDPFVPIIMLTAHNELYRVLKARDAGINGYLTKPVSAKSLYMRICSIIDNPRPYIHSHGEHGYFGPTRRHRDVSSAIDLDRRTIPPIEVIYHTSNTPHHVS